MTDSPFQRRGSNPRTTPVVSDPNDSRAAEPVIVEVVDGPHPRDTPSGSHRSSRQGTRIVVAAVIGLVVGGLSVAVFTVDPRPPEPVVLTVDSFPRAVFGRMRADVDFRDAGSKAALDRLDTQFETQLQGYRFAYGGDGAQFDYGQNLTLTIVNGSLAPAVPVAGNGVDWDIPMAVSLMTDDTFCVSEVRADEPDQAQDEVFIDPETGSALNVEELESTDCVLIDTEHNLSLRLAGAIPLSADDALTTAAAYRDELESIHVSLID